jgi:hypothetical protein
MEDKTAKKIRRMHLHPARNAIFHFSPEHFADKDKDSAICEMPVFEGEGKKEKGCSLHIR